MFNSIVLAQDLPLNRSCPNTCVQLVLTLVACRKLLFGFSDRTVPSSPSISALSISLFMHCGAMFVRATNAAQDTLRLSVFHYKINRKHNPLCLTMDFRSGIFLPLNVLQILNDARILMACCIDSGSRDFMNSSRSSSSSSSSMAVTLKYFIIIVKLPLHIK